MAITQSTVTRFTCSDGMAFDDRAGAEAYEAESREVRAIVARLPSAGRLSHGTYVEHDASALREVKRDLFSLIVDRYGDQWPKWKSWNADDVHPCSVVGRVMDDMGGPLADAWRRLAVYDFDSGREYDQPYFVAHPDEAVPASR